MSLDVLLVEDDGALADVYVRSLSGTGLRVKHCADAMSGYMMACKTLPKLITLDIILGKQNGFYLLKKLRRNPETMEIPVVIITNLSTDELELREELRASLGVVGVYNKAQLSLGALGAMVQQQLETV